MDAIALLKQDHTEVKKLFSEVEALGERAHASRRKLFQKISEALELHTMIEENVFYPAFRSRAEDTEERDQVLEALEEHGVAKILLGELQGLPPTEETFKPKLSVLMESVRHHIKEEEGQLFKTARNLFDVEELKELGERLQSAKKILPVEPARPKSRRGEVETAREPTVRIN